MYARLASKVPIDLSRVAQVWREACCLRPSSALTSFSVRICSRGWLLPKAARDWGLGAPVRTLLDARWWEVDLGLGFSPGFAKGQLCLKHRCQGNIPQSSIAASNPDTATCPDVMHFKRA